VSGEVVFERFEVRVDGEDTGDGERLAGGVSTASISYTGAPALVGEVEARFDFEPPRRPLREFE
jgi:hypothetical protein